MIRKCFGTRHIKLEHIVGEKWMVTTPYCTMPMSTGEKSKTPSPTDYLLMSLGVSSSNTIKEILESSSRKIKSINTTVNGIWTNSPTPQRLKEVTIKYEFNSPNTTKEEFSRLGSIVLESIDPIANTLTSKTSIKMTGSVKNE